MPGKYTDAQLAWAKQNTKTIIQPITMSATFTDAQLRRAARALLLLRQRKLPQCCKSCYDSGGRLACGHHFQFAEYTRICAEASLAVISKAIEEAAYRGNTTATSASEWGPIHHIMMFNYDRATVKTTMWTSGGEADSHARKRRRLLWLRDHQ